MRLNSGFPLKRLADHVRTTPEALQKVIEDIPPQYSRFFWLYEQHYVQHRTWEQLAKQEGITADRMQRRIYKLVSMLRNRLIAPDAPYWYGRLRNRLRRLGIKDYSPTYFAPRLTCRDLFDKLTFFGGWRSEFKEYLIKHNISLKCGCPRNCNQKHTMKEDGGETA